MGTVVTAHPERLLPPGTTVRISVGAGEPFNATVVEDLGAISPDGKHVVRVRSRLDPDGPESIFDVTLDVASLPAAAFGRPSRSR